LSSEAEKLPLLEAVVRQLLVKTLEKTWRETVKCNGAIIKRTSNYELYAKVVSKSNIESKIASIVNLNT
jgi:hypothetical protein